MTRAFNFLLGLTLFALANFGKVLAVFDDEVDAIDWHLDNIGNYEYVTSTESQDDHNQLVIVSSLGNNSLLTWVNSTDGKVLDRLPLDIYASDAATSGPNELVLRNSAGEEITIDLLTGTEIKGSETIISRALSPCRPDTSLTQLIGRKLKVLDDEKQQVVFLYESPDDIKELVFFNKRNDGDYEIIISTDSGKFHFLRIVNYELSQSWIRDESIANIKAFAFVSAKDPLSAKIFAEVSQEDSLGFLEAYIYRLQQTLQRLVSYLAGKNFSVGRIVKEILFGEDDAATSRQKDISFGLLKYLIVATDKGKIVNLDARSGKEVWFIETHLEDISKMEVTKFGTELLVFTKSGISLLFEISAIEKQPFLLSKSRLPANVFAEPFADGDFVYLELEDHSKVVLNSSTRASEDTYLLFHDDTHLSASLYHNDVLEDTWSIDLDKNEKVLAFADRDQSPVVSLGSILGNRTVLYKYLYPYLAAYITGDFTTNTMTLRVVDIVTGEIVHSVYHNDGVDLQSSINLVVGENWVIYTYFSNDPLPEQKIGVLEFYESLTPNVRLSNESVTVDPLSNGLKPEVVQKAYIYPEAIKNLALTRTKFGITIRSVILELENGQITSLPKYILNARRVEEALMSADDKKEFLNSPYVSAIPISDFTILTHHRRVLSGPSSHLTSVPTNLESTSIVCSLGHDLFCTRVSPSSQFDKLKPSFQKGQLIATVVGLFVLCFFIRPMVDTKKLKTKWLVKG
ncbi:LAFA_0G00892g1_1 [Lachancea sp. 'fantastica']|nr:LAFA_0G00892g1_1 [Lachancea sp. 'fantastica']